MSSGGLVFCCCGILGKGRAYSRMAVGKGIVDSHVFEEPANMGLEEAFDLLEIELGVNKDGTDVGLYYIW